MMLVLSGILQGVVSGVVIAAVAAGMSLIYRVSHVTNFLHGSLLALALYVTLDLSRRFAIDPLYFSIPMVPIMGLVGLALYWTLIRPVRRRHHLLLVQLLLGASFVIDSLLLMRYGADLQSVSNSLSSRFVSIFGTGFGLNELFASAISALTLCMLAAAVNLSDWGRKFRAVASDELASRLAGVSVEGVEAVSWMTGIAMLGLIAPAMGWSRHAHSRHGPSPHRACAGHDDHRRHGVAGGTILAGILVGMAQSLGLLFLPGSYGALLPYALLVAVLIFRPAGVASMMGRV